MNQKIYTEENKNTYLYSLKDKGWRKDEMKALTS